MTEEHRFRLKYVGARFTGKRLPVEVLPDLAAFRELLVSYAKIEWRKLNEGRQRVPKGFDAGLAFDLVAVEDGSAMPVVEWNHQTSHARLPGFTDQMEDVVETSFGNVVSLFREAAAGYFPSAMAPEQIRALNRFGSNLHENEKIEFHGQADSTGKVVYLTPDLRKRLISSLRDRYESQIATVGKLLGCVIAETHDQIGRIVVEAPEYGRFEVPMDNEAIKAEFDGNIEQPIEFNLTVQLDHEDQVKSVLAVHSVSIIDEEIAAQVKRCRDRLSQVQGLQTGWHDGEGEAPSAQAIEAANKFLGEHFALSARYRIYPTDEGGVLFEFEAAVWDLSVEFRSDGRVSIYGVEIKGNRSIDEAIFETLNDDFRSKFNEVTK